MRSNYFKYGGKLSTETIAYQKDDPFVGVSIDIFTKLFAISIVASSFWGLLSNCTMVFCPFSSSSSSSVLDKEKSAVSDPDIRAEQPNKKININALMIKSAVGEANN